MVAAKVLEERRPDVIDSTGPPALSRRPQPRPRPPRSRSRPVRRAAHGAVSERRRGALSPRDARRDRPLRRVVLPLRRRRRAGAARRASPAGAARFAPRAVAYHYYSRSAGAYSAQKAFHVERNRIWIVLRHFPPSSIVASLGLHGSRAWPTTPSRPSPVRVPPATWRGRAPPYALLSVTLRAWASALRGVPRQLRARRRLVASRRLGVAEFRSLLREFRLSAREAAFKE